MTTHFILSQKGRFILQKVIHITHFEALAVMQLARYTGSDAFFNNHHFRNLILANAQRRQFLENTQSSREGKDNKKRAPNVPDELLREVF